MWLDVLKLLNYIIYIMDPIVETSNAPEEKKVTIVKNPYKSLEYQKFIQTVKDGKVPEHWEILAETLGIRRETISEWKKLPEFAEAVNAGLDEALKMMKETGGKDWKMWRERVSILSREKKTEATPINVNTQINLDGYVDKLTE